jgi:hypothetical protein
MEKLEPFARTVNRTFDVDRLPAHLDHLECYTLHNGSIAIIERKGSPLGIAFFERGATGRVICNCAQAKDQGSCDHQQALTAGLWDRLTTIPQHKSLLTCTRDWCTPDTSPLFSFKLDISSQVAALNWEMSRWQPR